MSSPTATHLTGHSFRSRGTAPSRPVGLLAVSIAILALGATSASAQNLDWAKQVAYGGNAADSWVSDLKVSDGFVYAAGTYVAYPTIDCFVRKLDLAGNEIWSRQFGTTDSDEVSVLHVEGSQVFVGGVTMGAFEGFTDTTPWTPDPFVRTYDTDGNLVGTVQIPRLSPSFSGSPNVAFIDATGVYGTDVVDVDFFNQDVQVFKYDHAGNLLFSSQFGTSTRDQAGTGWPRSLSVDASGIYVTGSTQGTFPGQTLAGFDDIFVARLDLAGNLVWVQQSGSLDSWTFGTGVASDGSGVYVSGMHVAFTGETRLFVMHHDAAGTLLWTRDLSFGPYETLFSGITADASGVCVSGGTETAFPGFTSAGGRDVFARRYDASGDEVWTVQFGSAGADEPYGVATSGGDTYLGGIARGALAGSGASTGSFVAKIAAPASVDTDGDGLSDADEVLRGTNPMDADTDDDAIQDGPEVALGGVSSCPSPLVPDSDGDGLFDGHEVNTLGTSPCLVDTDGDGLSDLVDPQPLTAGSANDVVESILRSFATLTRSLSLDLFVGNNPNAKAGKRNALANKFDHAADTVHAGDVPAAIAELTSLLQHIEGPNASNMFMICCFDQADMAAAVHMLIDLL